MSQTLSLPAGKHKEILDLLHRWLIKTSCTLTELQSLIGSLIFASKCIPAGRLFTRRLIAMLSHEKTTANKNIILNADFFCDINWWIEFLPKWNGKALFLEPHWTRACTVQLYTDASATLGCGGFYDGAWFQSRWPGWLLSANPCIEFLEMFPILIALQLWGHTFSKKRLIFHCDNLGATQAWSSYNSKNRGVLELMRRMVTVAAKFNFTITIKHIPGLDNGIADALSRFQMTKFHRLVPNAACSPVPIPDIFSDKKLFSLVVPSLS